MCLSVLYTSRCNWIPIPFLFNVAQVPHLIETWCINTNNFGFSVESVSLICRWNEVLFQNMRITKKDTYFLLFFHSINKIKDPQFYFSSSASINTLLLSTASSDQLNRSGLVLVLVLVLEEDDGTSRSVPPPPPPSSPSPSCHHIPDSPDPLYIRSEEKAWWGGKKFCSRCDGMQI